MAAGGSREPDFRALWVDLLSDDLVANLRQSCRPGVSVHSLNAKMLLKVTFSQLRDRILEASTAKKKLEEQEAKTENLAVCNETLLLELEELKQKMTQLEKENKQLKESRRKRLSDESVPSVSEKKPKVETVLAPDTNVMLLTSPLKQPRLTVPESLSDEEVFTLHTPEKSPSEEVEEPIFPSPVISRRRCSSALSGSSSPHSSQKRTPTKRFSRLSLTLSKVSPKKEAPEEPEKAKPEAEEDATFFDEEEFKLFDSPETAKQKKRDQLKKDKEKEEDQFGFFRGEVVRRKEERQKLPGWECHDCQKAFCDGMNSQDKRKLINKCSKHRQVQPVIGNTPTGFWDLGILKSPVGGKTQKCKLNVKKNKGTRLIDKAKPVSLEDDLDWD